MENSNIHLHITHCMCPTHSGSHLKPPLCPVIDASGCYLTSWDAPNELEEKSANAAATAKQRHITYHKVSQSHLPALAGVERKQRQGREEEVGADDRGGGRFGEYQQNKRAAYAAVCLPAIFPSPRSLWPSPCDHIGSEAEHEGANEGADLPRRPLPSPLLLFQATLANTAWNMCLMGL